MYTPSLTQKTLLDSEHLNMRTSIGHVQLDVLCNTCRSMFNDCICCVGNGNCRPYEHSFKHHSRDMLLASADTGCHMCSILSSLLDRNYSIIQMQRDVSKDQPLVKMRSTKG